MPYTDIAETEYNPSPKRTYVSYLTSYLLVPLELSFPVVGLPLLLCRGHSGLKGLHRGQTRSLESNARRAEVANSACSTTRSLRRGGWLLLLLLLLDRADSHLDNISLCRTGCPQYQQHAGDQVPPTATHDDVLFFQTVRPDGLLCRCM